MPLGVASWWIVGLPSPDGQTRQQTGIAEDATEDHADESQKQDALDHDNRG